MHRSRLMQHFPAVWHQRVPIPPPEFADYDGRDRYLQHQLRPGESREFEAWLQITTVYIAL